LNIAVYTVSQKSATCLFSDPRCRRSTGSSFCDAYIYCFSFTDWAGVEKGIFYK